MKKAVILPQFLLTLQYHFFYVHSDTATLNFIEPPSLAELIRRDHKTGFVRGEKHEQRRLDGDPLYWSYVRERLLALEDEVLAAVVAKVCPF